MQGYDTLLMNEDVAQNLKQLTIHQSESLTFLAHAMDPETQWPALTSLNLQGCNAMSEAGVQMPR